MERSRLDFERLDVYDRAHFHAIARGSALECAAILDVLLRFGAVTPEDVSSKARPFCRASSRCSARCAGDPSVCSSSSSCSGSCSTGRARPRPRATCPYSNPVRLLEDAEICFHQTSRRAFVFLGAHPYGRDCWIFLPSRGSRNG